MAERTFMIGDWTFAPAANELRRGDERRRLEDRAARTLALLCARPGEPVAQEAIVAEVWNGRSQSPNSVPVVIGDLRRALDDDARRPRYIETVAKRGYRLIAPSTVRPPATSPASGRRWLPLAILLLIAAAVAGWLLTRPATDTVRVAEVVNATGDPAYDPLARATSELIVTTLDRRGVAVTRGEGGLGLEAKLVLWNGEPTVGLTATDASGAVRWSAMARGPAARIAPNVIAALDDFAVTLDR